MTHAERTRAFTVVPVVALLVVTLIGLGVALGVRNSQRPLPAGISPQSAYGKGNRAGATFGPVLAAAGLGVVMLGAAGRIADRSGQGTATALIGGVLLLAHVPYAVNLVRTLTTPGTAPVRTAMSTPLSGASLHPSSATPRPTAARPRVSEGQNRTSARAAERPTRAPFPAPAPADAEHARVEMAALEVIDLWRTKMNDRIETVLKESQPFFEAISLPPAHSVAVLRKRSADAGTVRAEVSDLTKDLRDAGDEVKRRLLAAGLSEAESTHRSVRFSIEFGANHRAFAADRLIDLVDRVKEECTALETHFPAWTLQNGEIIAKDASLRGKVASPRFFIDSMVKSLPKTMDQVRGRWS